VAAVAVVVRGPDPIERLVATGDPDDRLPLAELREAARRYDPEDAPPDQVLVGIVEKHLGVALDPVGRCWPGLRLEPEDAGSPAPPVPPDLPPGPSILTTLDAPKLFGSTFAAPTWSAWRTLLAALYALPPAPGDLERFRELTGRKTWPAHPYSEAWFVIGRRAGKSRIAALLAVFTCCFREWRSVLSPGERGTFMVLAADRRQARVVFRYVAAFVDQIPMLAAMVEKRTAEAIYFTNGTVVEVHTVSFRSVRGYTLLGVVCDEIAFWRSEESANPDAEVLAALRPGMATVPGALLLGISSPYARRGELWHAHRRHYGQDASEVLVVQAPTRALNPTVPARVIERAYQEDPASAAAEYGAEFRVDVEGFLTREAVEGAVVPGRRELPPLPGVRYRAFVDPSGGSSDSMTLAISHQEGDQVVLDCIRERRPPFSPEDVVQEFAEVLRTYRVRKVVGDRYAGEWPRERFRAAGIEYEPSASPKSDLYRELLPAVNAGRVELLDSPRLVAQLVGLERRTARGGRDSIDHAPGAHDDLANAVAGALVRRKIGSRVYIN
jgi:hypothetical protein